MIGHRPGHRLGHKPGHALGDGRALPNGSFGPVRYIGKSASVANSSGLNANVDRTIAGAAVGDLLVAIHVTTSAPTTPSGWTQATTVTNGSFSQRLTVYTKTATSGDLTGTQTFAQATSGFCQATIIALRGASATPVVDVIATGSIFQDTHNPQPIVGATALSAGLAIAIACPAGTSGTITFTASAGWTQPYGGVFNSRVGAAYRNVKAGDVLSGTITCSDFADGTTKSWSKATLTFK